MKLLLLFIIVIRCESTIFKIMLPVGTPASPEVLVCGAEKAFSKTIARLSACGQQSETVLHASDNVIDNAVPMATGQEVVEQVTSIPGLLKDATSCKSMDGILKIWGRHVENLCHFLLRVTTACTHNMTSDIASISGKPSDTRVVSVNCSLYSAKKYLYVQVEYESVLSTSRGIASQGRTLANLGCHFYFAVIIMNMLLA